MLLFLLGLRDPDGPGTLLVHLSSTFYFMLLPSRLLR